MRNLLLLLVMALVLQCCKHSTGPTPTKNAREYTWTIDTIAYPDPGSEQTLLGHIWGSSEQDVYVAGHNDLGSGHMYHFDGQAWRPVRLLQWEGGPLSSIGDFEDVFGFSNHDVYAVGNKFASNNQTVAFIIHYDGTQWQDISVLDSATVTSSLGLSPHDMWFGTMYGNLHHYDGHTYTLDTLNGIVRGIGGRYREIVTIVGNSADEIFILCWAPKTVEDRYFVLRRYSGAWSILDSTYDYVSTMWLSPSGKLYRGGYGMWLRGPSGWQTLPPHMTTVAINGTSDNNIIAAGSISRDVFRGIVYYYDGSDWIELEKLSLANTMYTDIWLTEKSIFIVGWLFGTPQRTIVVRGQ